MNKLEREYKYHSISIYKVEGIIPLNPGMDDVCVINKLQDGLEVLLTSNPDLHSNEIDKGLAIKSLVFKALFKDGNSQTVDERIDKEILNIREARSESDNGGAYLVIKFTAPTTLVYEKSSHKNTESFDFYIDSKVKQDTVNKNNHINRVVLAAFQLTAPSVSRYTKIRSGSYLADSKGKFAYYGEIKIGSVRGFVSVPVDRNLISLQNSISSLLSQDSLGVAISFHLQSVEQTSDSLRSFLFSWTALEILIHELYKIQRKDSGEQKEPKLIPKFIFLCNVYESNDVAKGDIEKIKKIYRLRNDIVHGNVVYSDEILSLGTCQSLFIKYLNYYLDTSNSK